MKKKVMVSLGLVSALKLFIKQNMKKNDWKIIAIDVNNDRFVIERYEIDRKIKKLKKEAKE